MNLISWNSTIDEIKALTRNETEKENVQTPLSSRKGVSSTTSSRTGTIHHRSRHRGMKCSLFYINYGS